MTNKKEVNMNGNKGNTLLRAVIVLLSLVVLLTFFAIPGLAILPSGATVTSGVPQTAPADVAGSASAFAGNTTEISISGFTTTQSWQGFFGNVTGTIQLANANDDVFYNWSLANPEGEVYASTNQSITWGSIQCFNHTATGTRTTDVLGGIVSLNGTNMSQLETEYGINFDDVDGVNETFFTTVAGDTHDAFFTNSLSFTAGECVHAKPYSSAAGPAANQFEEVLLYEPLTYSILFASILEEATVTGFDGGDHDFQMLVLENGHGTDISITTYYFFVEIE